MNYFLIVMLLISSALLWHELTDVRDDVRELQIILRGEE